LFFDNSFIKSHFISIDIKIVLDIIKCPEVSTIILRPLNNGQACYTLISFLHGIALSISGFFSFILIVLKQQGSEIYIIGVV